MSAQLEPRRFNVTEYYQMAEAGILTPDDRVEQVLVSPTIEGLSLRVDEILG